jgi:hypothetical protein
VFFKKTGCFDQRRLWGFERSRQLPEARTTAIRRKGMEKGSKRQAVGGGPRGVHQALIKLGVAETKRCNRGNQPSGMQRSVRGSEWWASTGRTKRRAGWLLACHPKSLVLREMVKTAPGGGDARLRLTPTADHLGGDDARERLAMHHEPITSVIVVMLFLERQTRAGKKGTNSAMRSCHWLARAKR